MDDSRFATLSQCAAITVAQATNDYAVRTGVIVDTQKDSTSTLLVTPQEALHEDQRCAFKGTPLGGQPEVVKQKTFLGIQEQSGLLPSAAALKQIEKAGMVAGLLFCKTTIRPTSNMPARKVYMQRAQQNRQNLLALAVPSPMAAARLTTLQGRLAKLVLYGRA